MVISNGPRLRIQDLRPYGRPAQMSTVSMADENPVGVRTLLPFGSRLVGGDEGADHPAPSFRVGHRAPVPG